MANKKTTDADWGTWLDKAKKGEIVGDEVSEITGETNDEGEQKLLHHFKARKIFIRGSSKNKKIVPEAEAKEILKNWKKQIKS